MSLSTSASEFFIAGGTLRPDAPSYVKRPADDELFNLALAGEFCYVLTPRQMGKSSLMARTANRLKEQGVSTAIIDLTKIGTVAVGQWYLGLLTRLIKELKLSVALENWWQERASLGRVQRFTDFLRDVILTEIKGQVIIFIDEIDTTLKLDFTDDFFAAIRAVYNARADDPEFKRLTFVLLGVAAPADLIKDRIRTPFNIGRGVALQEFSQTDAAVLQAGLETVHPGQGEAIFTRIYHWTNGHPYLTQKLCLSVAETEDGNWDDKQIDRLVERLFLSEKARKETNLQFVRDGVQRSPNRRRLLAIYRQVYQGEEVPDDERSLDKNRLKLLGLVKSEGRVLKVRNEIYRRVFNPDWVKENTPVDWTRRVATVLPVIVLLLVGVVAYLILRQPQQSAVARAQTFIDTFREATSADVRVANLAGLFQIPGYEDQARALFFNELSLENQVALFERANAQAIGDQLVIGVKGLYTHLNDTPAGNQLLQVMAQALRKVDDSVIATNTATEIEQWLEGRNHAAQEHFEDAVGAYDTAIDLNPDNIGTRFDRALAYTELGKYEDALADFDAVLEIVSRAPPTPTPIPASSPIPTSSPTSPSVGNSPTPALEAKISPTPTSVPTFISTPSSTPTPTATFSMPSSSAQRFTGLEQIVAGVREEILANDSLLSALSANQSSYTSLTRIVVVAIPTPSATNTSTVVPTTATPVVVVATETPTATNTPVSPTAAPTLSPTPTSPPTPTLGIVAVNLDPCEDPNNLTYNCQFNKSFPGGVPEGWTRFDEAGNPVFDQSHDTPFDGTSLRIWSDGVPFISGIYQQVPNVTPGTAYIAAIGWAPATTNWERQEGYIERMLGIDPFGGTDSTSPNVVWGPVYSGKSRAPDLSVSAVAQNTTVTVFVRVRVPQSHGVEQAFLDAVGLKPAPSQLTPTSSPTILPSDTPTPIMPPPGGPMPSIDFKVITQRMLSMKENGGDPQVGGCGVNHTMYINVIDINGMPLDGIVVGVDTPTGERAELVTGEKGPGRAEFPMYGLYIVRVLSDANRDYTSEVTRRLDSLQPTAEDLWNVGYCQYDKRTYEECAELRDLGPGYLCYGHYSYEVVFQRQW